MRSLFFTTFFFWSGENNIRLLRESSGACNKAAIIHMMRANKPAQNEITNEIIYTVASSYDLSQARKYTWAPWGRINATDVVTDGEAQNTSRLDVRFSPSTSKWGRRRPRKTCRRPPLPLQCQGSNRRWTQSWPTTTTGRTSRSR